jgi:hypothetical protein
MFNLESYGIVLQRKGRFKREPGKKKAGPIKPTIPDRRYPSDHTNDHSPLSPNSHN